MLREQRARSPDGGLHRRWFADDFFDLYVWSDAGGATVRFELCYGKPDAEHALDWTPDGFSHHAVDPGEDDPIRNMTPVLVPDGAVPWARLRERFLAASAELPAGLRDFVLARLVSAPEASRSASASEITLRAATSQDVEFLFRLLREALGPYVAATYGGWHEPEQRALFFERTRPEDHQVVELGGQPIGCLLVERAPDEIRLQRVMILPPFQGRGIGTRLIQALLQDARAARLPVRLQVLRANPRAQALYARLGFVVSGETQTHVQMERAA